MRRLAVFFVPLLTLILATCAQAQGWQVEKITQPVEYTLDAQTWNLLQAGMEVPNTSWIKTGARGRLILRRQAEMIQFKPNTVASITAEVEAGVRKTRIKQKAGSILLDVELARPSIPASRRPSLLRLSRARGSASMLAGPRRRSGSSGAW